MGPCLLQQDLVAWFFKSTTNFYLEELHMPWWFGVGCFGYSIAGIMMFLTKPKWIDNCRFFPYRGFALYLIFVQGPLSFLADYKNMTNDSIFHVIDRFSASASMVLELSKIGAMFYHKGTRPMTSYLYLLAAVLAIVAFYYSQLAQAAIDRDLFVFWHNMWHMYPYAGSVIIGVDRFVFGEYERADIKTPHTVSSYRPVPLSTLLMRQVSALNETHNPFHASQYDPTVCKVQ